MYKNQMKLVFFLFTSSLYSLSVFSFPGNNVIGLTFNEWKIGQFPLF